ncbi:MAG TPA: hypothetical protein VNM92_13520 [Thermoanaerobaculia bacterium]|nr:hypothetical protein [Thermoanaerobaculia bacterium]
MRKNLCLFIVVTVICALGASDLYACGDKYLSIGRGSRFQRGYVSLHPVSIAVLRSNVTGRKDFLSRLKVAGHHLDVADDSAKLEAMLKKGKYELVLADYEDAARVYKALDSLPSKPLFLPVVDATSSLSQIAKKEHGCMLNAGSTKKQKSFLAVLDEAVDAKLKTRPHVCDIAGK